MAMNMSKETSIAQVETLLFIMGNQIENIRSAMAANNYYSASFLASEVALYAERIGKEANTLGKTRNKED